MGDKQREIARGCQENNLMKNIYLTTRHGDDEHEPDVRERLFYQKNNKPFGNTQKIARKRDRER